MSILALRAIHRCLADLRCGAPVLLRGEQDWVLLAAENAAGPGLDAWKAQVSGPYLIGVASWRAAAIGSPVIETANPQPAPNQAQILTVPPALLTSPVLHGLADPTDRTEPPVLARHAAPMPDLPAILALAKAAHLLPAVLIGSLAADKRDSAMLSIDAAAVIAYPRTIGGTLHRVSEASVALADIGTTRIISFRPADGSAEHLAIVIGAPQNQDAPLVRIHSECFTGDLLASLRCDCGPQLHASLHAMAKEGHGVVLYLAQEGRGIGLPNKLRAYLLQDGEGNRPALDTLDANHALGWEADERDFAPAAAMLRSLQISRARLMTNNPAKLAVLAAEGITIVGQEPNRISPNGVNDQYLKTKRERFGHTL